MVRRILSEDASKRMDERSGFLDNIRKNMQIADEVRHFGRSVVEDFRARDNAIDQAIQAATESREISVEAKTIAQQTTSKVESELKELRRAVEGMIEKHNEERKKEYKEVRDFVDQKVSELDHRLTAWEQVKIAKGQLGVTRGQFAVAIAALGVGILVALLR